MLRYAPRFHKKKFKKKFPNFFSSKKVQKSKIFYALTLTHVIEGPPANIWGSRPAGLGGDRDCTNST
jgi:hypothetical protein